MRHVRNIHLNKTKYPEQQIVQKHFIPINSWLSPSSAAPLSPKRIPFSLSTIRLESPRYQRMKQSKLAMGPRAHLSLPPASQNSCSSWKNRVKLIIVPYISKPPTTDITAAPPAICAECHRSVGKAIGVSEIELRACETDRRSLWRKVASSYVLGVRHRDQGEHSPMPITTKKPVRNRPKSITPEPELSMKSSGFAARPHIQFGNGAMT
jgi:hypothetical protein